MQRAWNVWSNWVAPEGTGFLPAKPGESWKEYYTRYRCERLYEFVLSETVGIIGGWSSIVTTGTHSAITEGLKAVAVKQGENYVMFGGKGFLYMRGVPAALKWRQVAIGAKVGSKISVIITVAATAYRIGLRLDAWLRWKLTHNIGIE